MKFHTQILIFFWGYVSTNCSGYKLNLHKNVWFFLLFFSTLTSKVDSLQTEGCTALGPAVSVAMGIAMGTAGSEIVLCTDGAPNQGVGGNSSGETKEAFYKKVW